MLWRQSGQMSAVECQEIKKVLEDGALDVLAPSSAAQKDISEFRERVLQWMKDLDSAASSHGIDSVYSVHRVLID